MSNKSKFSTITTQQVLFPTNSGSIKINTDDSGKIFIGSLSAPGTSSTLVIDPIQNKILTNKIVVDEVTFQDGSNFSLTNNLIPSSKIPEIPESKLSSEVRTKINSSNSAISSYFDENGKLRENNAPIDYSEIRTKANDGKTIADTLSGFFDNNNKLKTNNLADSVVTTTNFNDTFDTRFNSKNPITTTNFGSNFDTAFSGKNAITTANFGSNFDTAFTGKNPVTTGVSGNFDDLFDGKVPTGYETWNALAINATNGNEALSKFSGAGGKLPIDSVIPPGSYTGWGDINTDIAKGISADNDLNGLDFSIDNSDPNNPIVKINKGGSRGFATNTIGKSSIGLGNVANESPTTIRQGVTIDENGALQGIGNGSGTTISNNRVTLQLAGQTLTFNNGTSNPILLDSGNVGLGNVENKSSTDIRNEIQIVNGVLSGIGTSGIVVNNDSISLSRDATTGEIILDKGIGTPVRANPFTSTKFTDVSSSADSAKTTANTVRGFFTDIPNQIPQLNLTYLPTISESKLSSVVTTKLGYANTINGYFTAGKLNEANAADALKNSNVTKASIGLPNVEDVSPTQIREGIGLSVDSTTGQISITRSGTTTLTVNPLSSTEFTSTKTNASNALTNAASAQSTANSANTTATTVRNFFGTETIPQLKDSNTPAGLKNSNVSLSLSGQTFIFNNGTAQNIPISKDNVGLNQVANESPATIRSGITVINGVLTGIGTSNIVVDNSSINLTRDETTGEITLNKGIGSPITIDPFSATRFTTLSGTVNSTNTLANEIDNRFTNGILKESNAADSLKNSNVFSDSKFIEVSGTANTALQNAATAQARANDAFANAATVFSDSRFIEVSGTANTALQNANTGIENAAIAQSTADTVSGYFSFGVIKSSSLPANLKQTNVTVSNANLDISNSTYYSNLFIRDGRTLNSSITLTIPLPSNCSGCRLIIYRGTNTLIKNPITIKCALTSNYFISGTSVSSTIQFSPDSQTKPLELYSNGAQWFIVS